MPTGMVTQQAGRTVIAVLAVALLSMIFAGAVRAADSVYWVSYGSNKISHANLGEGGGADVPIPDASVSEPYGLAIDSAAGKVYWLNKSAGGSIGYANLDGSASGRLNTAGASFANPAGLAIDPANGRIYWGNPSNGTIGYANLNGSGGGQLNTGPGSEPNGLAIDSAGNRIFWSNFGTDKISYVGLGGGPVSDLDTSGAPVDGPEGVAIDAADNKIYWANWEGDSIGVANLSGGNGGAFATSGTPVHKPVGLAFDPYSSSLYWANEADNTIVYRSVTGGVSGQVETGSATRNLVAFPVLLVRPHMLTFPEVQGKHLPGAALSCSTGAWRGDLLGAFLFQAPQSFFYQWFRNGQAVPGATTATITASKVGAYSCLVTAANFAGADSELSAVDFSVNATVALRKVTLNRRKGTATLRVTVTGAGRLDLYGTGVANAQRKHAQGTTKLTVRASGRARIKLGNTGKARIKARVSYTPEGGRAIKRTKTIVLKKKPRR